MVDDVEDGLGYPWIFCLTGTDWLLLLHARFFPICWMDPFFLAKIRPPWPWQGTCVPSGAANTMIHHNNIGMIIGTAKYLF